MRYTNQKLERVIFVALMLSASGLLWAADAAYRSPYELQFTFSQKELIGDLLDGSRGAVREESSIPFEKWNSDETRKRWGSWGPPVRAFAPPEGAFNLEGKSAQWKRERVIAAALRYVGLHYHHHHIPDFDPPADWPKDSLDPPRENGKGVDCSNYTSFVYSLALGMKFNSDIHKQAALAEAAGPGAEKTTKFERIERPGSYAAFVSELRPGDLLFVRNKKDEVSHVVMWIGMPKLGDKNMTAGTPLILDSTGTGHRDSDGKEIPDGIQLRPFRKDGWYFNSASHGLRLIGDDQ